VARLGFSEYWIPQFRDIGRVSSDSLPPGWSVPAKRSIWFVEPEILFREGFGSKNANIKLIAAPGAVGKSTYAHELCAATGLILVDLARAETVAGNYLSGGLMRAGAAVRAAWDAHSTGLVIDALDEARMRVTQESFEDFLSDIHLCSLDRQAPTVIFGRSGIIEEIWLWFALKGIDVGVFDIQFFDKQRAVLFVENYLKRWAADRPNAAQLNSRLKDFAKPIHEAVVATIEHLATAAAQDTASSGIGFSGYAPVLEAAGSLLAEETNPSKHSPDGLKGQARDVLFTVVMQILTRESSKVKTALADVLAGQVPSDVYSPTEQKDRLCARLFKYDPPPVPQSIPNHLQRKYIDTVESFLPLHPFLDGAGLAPSSAVFDAELLSHGLLGQNPAARLAAERRALETTRAPNPFLVDFFEGKASRDDDALPFVEPEHVGLIDASVRGRLQAGQRAILAFTQEEDELATVRFEIVQGQNGPEQPIESREFSSSPAGVMRIPHKLAGATIVSDLLDVEIGDGSECELGCPILIDVNRLRFRCRNLSIMRDPALSDIAPENSEALLIANAAEVPADFAAPKVYERAILKVSWPGSKVFPWDRYQLQGEVSSNPKLAEAQRALRRLVINFRSHSKGTLARFKGKVEHKRMTKGEIGELVRRALMDDDVISQDNKFYYLDPDRLGSLLRTTFGDIRDKRFSEATNHYLQQKLGAGQSSS